jgi:hypothetical protein
MLDHTRLSFIRRPDGRWPFATREAFTCVD